MNSLDKEILEFINKASKRIKRSFLFNKSIVGIKYLLCLCFTILLVSLYITIPYVEEITLLILSLGIIINLIYWIIKSPDKKRITLLVDSKGLNERLTTSLELIGKEDKISIAQKKDTLKYIKNFNLKEKFKFFVEKKELIIIVGLIIMCILTFFVPSLARSEGSKIRKFNGHKNEVVEKIEEAKKDIEKIDTLTDKEKEDLKKTLEESKKEILEQQKKSELEKSLERAEKKLSDKNLNKEGKKDLEEVKKDLFDKFNKEKEVEAKEDLNKLLNELSKEKEAKDLLKAILSGDNEAVKEALENLEKSLESMSGAELEALSESLANSANSISGENLAQSLSQASQSILNGELNTEQLSQALQAMQSSTGNNNSNNSGAGENQGEGEGSGSGNGSNSGNGNGNGPGWNTGSTEGKENDIDNKLGEEIFIPGRDTGDDKNLTGNKNENGSNSQIETESGFNLNGEKIDYDKVIGDYSKEALESTDNSNLPESMKNIIKEYFDGLN